MHNGTEGEAERRRGNEAARNKSKEVPRQVLTKEM